MVYFADINRILGLHCTWKLDGFTYYTYEFRGVVRLTLEDAPVDVDSELEGIDELLSVVHVSEAASSNEEEIEDFVSEASSSNEEVDDD